MQVTEVVHWILQATLEMTKILSPNPSSEALSTLDIKNCNNWIFRDDAYPGNAASLFFFRYNNW